MLKQKFFEEISSKISEVLANSPAADVEKNLRAMLATGFSKLDLVTREEFDIQAQVLARTREQLTQLEARITALESRLNQATSSTEAPQPATTES
jgi:ubiquinone biosynthesis accessory factor UbiK